MSFFSKSSTSSEIIPTLTPAAIPAGSPSDILLATVMQIARILGAPYGDVKEALEYLRKQPALSEAKAPPKTFIYQGETFTCVTPTEYDQKVQLGDSQVIYGKSDKAFTDLAKTLAGHGCMPLETAGNVNAFKFAVTKSGEKLFATF